MPEGPPVHYRIRIQQRLPAEKGFGLLCDGIANEDPLTTQLGVLDGAVFDPQIYVGRRPRCEPPCATRWRLSQHAHGCSVRRVKSLDNIWVVAAVVPKCLGAKAVAAQLTAA